MWAYILLFVTFAVVLVFYFSPSYQKKITVTAMGPFGLDQENTVASIQDAAPLLGPSESTFQAFIYLNPMMRTGNLASCGTEPNQPSCADGTFAPCPCDPRTGDCTPCSHAGYLPVFNLCGVAVLEILPVPDASRQGKAMAQLLVRTETTSVTTGVTASQKYVETLPLPPIEVQKWTMVTVAREARRFDVYYNDKLVLSQKTMNMPISSTVNSNLRGVVSGSSGLVGQLANATVFNYRLAIQDVIGKYQELADTRGRPYIYGSAPQTLASGQITLSSALGLMPDFSKPLLPEWWYSSSWSLCPASGCFTAPVLRPSNPLYDWTSNYA
jgi:hypothetical protein